MWKHLLVALIAGILMFGCADSSDSDDSSDSSSVSLNGADTFKAESFAVGCFIVSDSSTQCICYEGGTEYTGDASGSTYCTDVASASYTLVADATTISSVSAGDHYYCSTTDANELSNLCTSSDSNRSTATIVAGTNYTVTYATTGHSIE